MKISDEFWTVGGGNLSPCCVLDKNERYRGVGMSESDARHICDLHNAALVQERRGWTCPWRPSDILIANAIMEQHEASEVKP